MVKASSLRSEGRGFESGEEQIHNITILGTGNVICERRNFSVWWKNERRNFSEWWKNERRDISELGKMREGKKQRKCEL